MDAKNFAELKFLLELASCSNQEASLSSFLTKSKSKQNKLDSKQRDEICQKLREKGIVDFSREIATVEIAPPGNALLNLEAKELPISVEEFEVLEKIGKKGKAKLSDLTTKKFKAAVRDKILQVLLEKNLVSAEMELNIITVEIAPPGTALLELETEELPLSEKEFKVLEQVAKKGNTKPSKITFKIDKKSLAAAERDEILQDFLDKGLVTAEIEKNIATVEVAPPGSDLLNSQGNKPPISEKEFKVLRKIAQTGKTKPSEIKSPKAAVRDKILQDFLDKGLVTAEMKVKRTGAKVWLTPQGKDCLEKVNQHFFSLQEVAEKRVEVEESKPTDEEIFQAIKDLDHKMSLDNYLPIFYLRDKFQPPLSREELDQALYRLENDDRIELGALQETRVYNSTELSAGIPQDIGGPLFFISVS
ncbi:MAG: hypothetical protein WBG70_06510 [Spirulinaceae cyanobacterium]